MTQTHSLHQLPEVTVINPHQTSHRQLRNRLGLGPKHIQRATAAAKVVREATADHEAREG